MQKVMNGGPADATHIIQVYIAAGLRARSHSLTCVAPLVLNQVICVQTISRIQQSFSNHSRFFRGQLDKYTWVDIGSS